MSMIALPRVPYFAHRMHVQDHVVAVDERALDLAVRLRILVAQERNELAEAVAAVGRVRVVLHVPIADVRERGVGIFLVQAFS